MANCLTILLLAVNKESVKSDEAERYVLPIHLCLCVSLGNSASLYGYGVWDTLANSV